MAYKEKFSLLDRFQYSITFLVRFERHEHTRCICVQYIHIYYMYKKSSFFVKKLTIKEIDTTLRGDTYRALIYFQKVHNDDCVICICVGWWSIFGCVFFLTSLLPFDKSSGPYPPLYSTISKFHFELNYESRRVPVLDFVPNSLCCRIF